MSSPTFAEVREADASPAVAAIYADIKQVTGIPSVNLIWRHLATDPQMLAWAWDVTAPVYGSEKLDAAIAALDVDISGHEGPPIWGGLAHAEDIRAVLAFYNRGNPANLVALTALVRAAGRELPQRSISATHDCPPRQGAGGAVAPLPKREDLAAETAALIAGLANRQSGAAIGVTPSLYLHLGHWPEAVKAAHARASRMLDDPTWADRLARLLSSADRAADTFAATLDCRIAAPPAAVRERFIAAIARFVTATIPEMVLIGRALAHRADVDT